MEFPLLETIIIIRIINTIIIIVGAIIYKISPKETGTLFLLQLCPLAGDLFLMELLIAFVFWLRYDFLPEVYERIFN